MEDYRKRELANLTQRADLSEMALFNYHQRFVLLSNELETKCNEERESKIRLFYTQQEVESLRAARPHMTHFSQQVSPRTPLLYESVAMMKIAKNYLSLFTTTSSLFTPLIKPLIPTLNYITPLCPLASIPPTMPQSEALDRTPTKNLRQESHVISVKENTPMRRSAGWRCSRFFTLLHENSRFFTIFHLIFCCFLVVKSRENV